MLLPIVLWKNVLRQENVHQLLSVRRLKWIVIRLSSVKRFDKRHVTPDLTFSYPFAFHFNIDQNYWKYFSETLCLSGTTLAILLIKMRRVLRYQRSSKLN